MAPSGSTPAVLVIPYISDVNDAAGVGISAAV